MRIAIINRSAREAGGIETYVDTVMPALAARGHDVGLLSERDGPADRRLLGGKAARRSWCVETSGRDDAVAALRGWAPDVVYLQSLDDVELEARVTAATPAPTVAVAHQYHGTCVSGTKTFAAPTPRPCPRQLGPGCLLHYYPHRCGGLSPVTMLRDYRRQRARLALLRRYDAVTAYSEHMRRELLAHGLRHDRVHMFPCPVTRPAAATDAPAAPAAPGRHGAWQLAFVGRMERLKGGMVLLEALPAVARALETPVHLTFAGDGRARRAWEARGAALRSEGAGVSVSFRGWLDERQLARLLAATHLLVMPSLWPEPFGLVGPEAGRLGVPAAGFDVGGIPEWLVDGVSGVLAAGDRPSSRSLADAIVRCLEDPARYAALQLGARRVAQRFNLDEHLDALLHLFDIVRR